MIKTLITATLICFASTVAAQNADKKATKPAPAKQAQKKAEPPIKANVKKPCKPGQTEADGCHEVKKAEKKKAPEKKGANNKK